MAISQFDKPAELPKVDFDFLLKARELNEAKKEKINTAVEDLSSKFNAINALPQDKEFRNKKINYYNSELNNWYEKYKDNLSLGLNDLRLLRNKFYQDATRGQLGAINSNYSARKAHEDSVNKAFADGKINQQRRDALLAADLNDYKGVGLENETDSYNSYIGSTPAKEVDINKKANELAEGWKADKIARGGYKQDASGLYFINNYGSKEYVNPAEIKQYVQTALMQDPEVKSFVDQETRLHNIGINQDSELYTTDVKGNAVQVNPIAYLQHYRDSFIDNASDLVAAKYGYTQEEYKQSDLSWVPEDIRTQYTGPQVETTQLTSVNIPQNNAVKIKGVDSGAGTRAMTTEEANKVYKKYNLINPDGSINTMSRSYEFAQSEIAAGVPKIAKGFTHKFTEEQNEIYNKLQKEQFKPAAKNDLEKAEMINDYIDYHNRSLIYPGIVTYDWRDKKTSELAERESKMFFDKTGPKLFNTRKFKLIEGDGPAELTGGEFSRQFGDDDEYTKTVTGKLYPDNPYFVNGNVISITDKNGKVSRYAMSGSNQELNKVDNLVIHNMAKSRYSPTGVSKITIPVYENNKVVQKNFTVEYQRSIDNTTETVTLKDSKGNVVTDSGGNPIILTKNIIGDNSSIFNNLYSKITE